MEAIAAPAPPGGPRPEGAGPSLYFAKLNKRRYLDRGGPAEALASAILSSFPRVLTETVNARKPLGGPQGSAADRRLYNFCAGALPA
jgi:hypothetical protein